MGSRLWAAPWCSGLTCHPVTVEIEGSNPFGVANSQVMAAGQIGQRLCHTSPQHMAKLRLGNQLRQIPRSEVYLETFDYWDRQLI